MNVKGILNDKYSFIKFQKNRHMQAIIGNRDLKLADICTQLSLRFSPSGKLRTVSVLRSERQTCRQLTARLT